MVSPLGWKGQNSMDSGLSGKGCLPCKKIKVPIQKMEEMDAGEAKTKKMSMTLGSIPIA